MRATNTDSFQWPIEEVERVASKYYDITKSGNQADRWRCAAREAVRYLLNRREACQKVLEGHRILKRMIAAQARRSPTPPAALSKPNAVDRAICYITGEKRSDRAFPKFKKVWLWKAGESKAREAELELESQYEEWRKTGIPVPEIVRLKREFERDWASLKSVQSQANARKRKKGL